MDRIASHRIESGSALMTHSNRVSTIRIRQRESNILSKKTIENIFRHYWSISV